MHGIVYSIRYSTTTAPFGIGYSTITAPFGIGYSTICTHHVWRKHHYLHTLHTGHWYSVGASPKHCSKETYVTCCFTKYININYII